MTYREAGVLALYRGFTPALMGIIPYSGIAFFTFETLKEWRLSEHAVQVFLPKNASDYS